MRTVQEVGQAVEEVKARLNQIRDACLQNRQDWLAGRAQEAIDLFAAPLEKPAEPAISEDRIREIIAQEIDAAGLGSIRPLTYDMGGTDVTFLTKG